MQFTPPPQNRPQMFGFRTAGFQQPGGLQQPGGFQRTAGFSGQNTPTQQQPRQLLSGGLGNVYGQPVPGSQQAPPQQQHAAQPPVGSAFVGASAVSPAFTQAPNGQPQQLVAGAATSQAQHMPTLGTAAPAHATSSDAQQWSSGALGGVRGAILLRIGCLFLRNLSQEGEDFLG